MISTRRLIAAFDLTPDQARQLRAAMAKVNTHAVSDALELASQFMNGYGVEVIRGDGHWDGFYGDIEAEYVNMGDTYMTTIVFDCRRGIYQIMCYGEWIEIAERRGVKIL